MKYKVFIFWGWKLYKFLAIAIGTLVFLYIIFAVIFLIPPTKVYFFDIPLQSGFTYHDDIKDGLVNGHHLRDKNNNVIIYSDVKQFIESGKTIYGYREDLHGNPFYFICDYGDDCASTQNLTDGQLRTIIKERRLPLYTSNSGLSRYDFEHEIKYFYKKNDSKTRPKWNYDKTWKKYRIIGAE